MSQPEEQAAQADTASNETTTTEMSKAAPAEPAPAEESVDQVSAPVTTPSTGGPSRPKVRRTRFSVLWTTVIIAALVLILLLIFILENNNSVQIEFLGASGKLPLGVAMLFAAVAGVLLVAIPGYGRILQLRRAVRKAGNRTK